jgi:hypothetical protein
LREASATLRSIDWKLAENPARLACSSTRTWPIEAITGSRIHHGAGT